MQIILKHQTFFVKRRLSLLTVPMFGATFGLSEQETDMTQKAKIGFYKAWRGGWHWHARLANGEQLDSGLISYRTKIEAKEAAEQTIGAL